MKRTVQMSLLSLCLVVATLTSLPSPARATFPYVFGGPAVNPIPGLGLPSPLVVPGKEYSEFTDLDMAGAADPEQVIAWDGNPFKTGFPEAGVLDTFDYSGSRPPLADNLQTDAIANSGDALFTSLFDPSLGSSPNATNLLYSIGSLSVAPPPAGGPVPTGVGPIGGTGDISFETTAGIHGTWASGPVDIDSMTPPRDIDGLEIWGGDPPSGPNGDANRYSHDVDAVSGVSVWAYDGVSVSTPFILKSTIDNVVTLLLGDRPADVDIDDIDVDALMVFDRGQIGEFDPGDALIFSIDQIPTSDPNDLDGFYATGSEIFTLRDLVGGVGLQFLFHGGHSWDHDWTNTFFVDENGVPMNLNALEAASVPEPSSIALAAFALLGLLAHGRRRRRA